jgi:undecaprenyl diphosphate synthase
MPGVLERLRLLRRASRPVEPALPEVARSIAIIMDGNARWARSRGLPVLAGHSAGTRALRRTVEACLEVGVDSLAVFAFSTENWNRPDDEVRGLLDLLAETIRREFPDMGRMGVRVRFVGRRDRCSPSILQLIEDTERDTAANEALTLWICFDYGGRSELVEGGGRPAGEQRLSNFLLWQTAYSEYVFTPTLWPDFGEAPLRAALAEYAGRRRRFGAR